MKKNKANKNTTGNIAQNKKARHDYFLEDKFEAGLELQGMPTCAKHPELVPVRTTGHGRFGVSEQSRCFTFPERGLQ